MTKMLSLPSLTTREQQLISEGINAEILKAPSYANYTKLYGDIPYPITINIFGEPGIVGKADGGCGDSPESATIAVTNKTWSPTAWSLFLRECYTDYYSTLIQPQINMASDSRGDLTRTDLVAFLIDKFGIALEKMIFRFLWFNDTTAALVTASPAGVITAGQTITHWNLYDGYFKQLYTICGSDATKKVSIAANAEATFALQDSQLTTTLAYTYLQNMTYNCSNKVKANLSAYKILATQELYDKACQYIQATTISDTFFYMENGVRVLRINGVEIVPMPLWSEYIRAYESDGTKYHDPHRAVLLKPDNFGIAVPGRDLVLNIEVFFDKISKYTYFRANGVMDMKIIQDDLVMFAY